MTGRNTYIHCNLLPLNDRDAGCSNKVTFLGTATYHQQGRCDVFHCRECQVRVYKGSDWYVQLHPEHPNNVITQGEVRMQYDLEIEMANTMSQLDNGPEDRSRMKAFLWALSLAMNELPRQERKWGRQLHSPAVWSVILAEEFGEFNKAILDWRAAWADYHEKAHQALETRTPLASLISTNQLGETEAMTKHRLSMIDELSQVMAVAWQIMHSLLLFEDGAETPRPAGNNTTLGQAMEHLNLRGGHE